MELFNILVISDVGLCDEIMAHLQIAYSQRRIQVRYMSVGTVLYQSEDAYKKYCSEREIDLVLFPEGVPETLVVAAIEYAIPHMKMEGKKLTRAYAFHHRLFFQAVANLCNMAGGNVNHIP